MTLPFLNAHSTEGAHSIPDQPFAFRNKNGMICAAGPALAIPRGSDQTLADRVGGFFNGATDGAMLGGALPFNKAEADYLWQVGRGDGVWLGDQNKDQGVTSEITVVRPRPQPSAQTYMDSVSRALDIMRTEQKLPQGLSKVVLARTLMLQQAQEIPLNDVLARLSYDPSVTAFQVALPTTGSRVSPRHLVGATPELLLSKSGAQITSHPLAGSAKRLDDPTADAAAAEGLRNSAKDQREHAVVVEYILDTLAPFCSELGAPDGATLTTTKSMWHIGTLIQGTLKDPETPAVVLASKLHPTPAVCGMPCDRAANLISELEPVPRDFYAGAVGWCDRSGDGAWYVAIRCAELCGSQARLYAGAGIVLGSEPQSEAAETGAKFGALLAALGLPRDAALQDLN
ncbi:isochorismate synthase [Loktanella sp. S4079]|uniref:isochorismate synthase n=1 Tax=Loktanella sp. S4079 TaxID=579483 RepID=UPI0005FA75C6|nr:isochorismate synthase [Loktanella sp. S4079]KJZ18613.1 isochorismate synthase [Loktanella sp. S4079]